MIDMGDGTLMMTCIPKQLLSLETQNPRTGIRETNTFLNLIKITDTAVSHLRTLLEGRTEDGLRLLIERGGCAGLQYGMKVDAAQPGDSTVEQDGVRVFIDQDSLHYLKGCQLDYVDTLADTGFKILNPNAARSCGCGTSFEPAAPAPSAPLAPPVPDGTACDSAA